MLNGLPYPDEIRKEWWSIMNRSSLSAIEKRYADDIIRYAQPPLSFETLETAAALYASDIHAREFNSTIIALQKTNLIGRTAPQLIGTHYPVYYALTNRHQFPRNSNAFTIRAKRYFSHLFASVAKDKKISPRKFYDHVIASRDVICAILKSDYNITGTQEPIEKKLLDAINSDSLYAQRNSLKGKVDIFTMLATKKISPGKQLRNYQIKGSRNSNSNSNTIKNDPWHNQHLSMLASVSSPRRILIRNELSDQYDSSVGQRDIIGVEMEIVQNNNRNKKNNGLEEVSEEITLQRSTPNMLTRADDQQLVRRFTRHAPASSLAAVTDLARLTDETIYEILGLPLDRTLEQYAILLLSLGLPPQRLMRLTISQHANAVTSDKEDERPYWCIAESMLCYRLLDGPSAYHNNPKNQWVKITLPHGMAQFFNSLELYERPFRGARGHLNRQLKRHFQNKPGTMPTANRLSASSWLYRRPHAIDDVSAATLSGQFRLGLAAPAAYRQLQRAECQQLFNKTLKHLGITEFISPIKASINTLSTPTTIGSAIAQSAEFFQPIFEKIREVMREPHAQMSGWWLTKPFPIDALISLSQLVSAHELLGWQLASGARPIGPSSENRIGKKHQWIHDKDSARGIESRVVPLLTSIRNSLCSLQRWYASLISVANSAGVVIDDQRNGRLDTPGWLFRAKRGQQVVIRDMRWSDLSALSLPNLSGWPSNVTRHSLATHLRSHVSDAQVDALLGHASYGRSLSSPRADTMPAINEQSQLRHTLQAWLKTCGYQPLDWSHMPWN
ncbi:hypothetical protein ELY33_14635 [Vreelandella andesensis]|uniref:Uncharacterized protein n=1 Tax=Vreelandella andesensis TaxID=447567 RepID=A0A3S0W4D4_9GAMM|nr:hypothetical protein [Halomonas andesensis]RUR27827.1 hypothetical protein ELY33_14635 [Halomonas andesensis]